MDVSAGAGAVRGSAGSCGELKGLREIFDFKSRP
jgi:hypothetical protein